MNQTFTFIVLTSLMAAKLICAAGIYDLDLANTTRGTCELTKIVLCRHSFQEQHECIKKCLPGHIFIDHHKEKAWKCDGWSFFGGIMSTIAILAIALVAYKYTKRSRGKNPEHNYSLM